MNRTLLVAVAIVVLVLISKKSFGAKETLVPNKPVIVPATEDEIKKGLMAVYAKYGKNITMTVEKIFRLESSHFSSMQFKTCNSAGMKKMNEDFPYGWTSMSSLWQEETLKPIGEASFIDDGANTPFLVFRTFTAGALALAEYIAKYSAGRWNGTTPERQQAYEAKLATITPKYCNQILPI